MARLDRLGTAHGRFQFDSVLNDIVILPPVLRDVMVTDSLPSANMRLGTGAEGRLIVSGLRQRSFAVIRGRSVRAVNLAVFVCMATFCLFQHASLARELPYGRAVLTGVKVSGGGDEFVAPGATVSVRRLIGDPSDGHVAGYGPSFGRDVGHFSTMLPAGNYEIGIQVPDGYRASYSVCNGCRDHPLSSFISYGTYNGPKLILELRNNLATDVRISYVRSADGTASLPADQGLTCNILELDAPTPPTDRLLFKGSDAWARVGINRNLGGIITELDLINPAAPADPLQIVDARSSGGAAWQSSLGVADEQTQRILHFNQAAGNSARVWGFAGIYDVLQGKGFHQQDWSPLFSNDYRTAVSFVAPIVSTSPCYHSGYRLGDGRVALSARVLQSNPGQVIELTNAYVVRFAADQRWKWLMADQGVYMDLASAREGNLRIYVASPGGPAIGPIKAYDSFEGQDAKGLRNVLCKRGDCMIATQPISYAMLVWTVRGRDIGMAVHLADPGRSYLGFVRLRTELLCKEGDRCGNLQFHARMVDGNIDPKAVRAFAAGHMENYTVLYDIGTPSQLAALGFKTPEAR